VVATRYDPKVDFGAFDTFAVNPTISVLRDVGDAGTLSPDKAAAVVDRIGTNMSARGYQMVDVSERPSLGLQATIYTQLNTTVATTSGSWWGAPGYAGTPAYWGYPGSSYYAAWSYPTNVYKSGTLIVECVALRDTATRAVDPGAGLEVAWTAYGHGIADELLTSLESAGLASIDQAFVQSPYLRHQEPTP
jgi:hypothetical protein